MLVLLPTASVMRNFDAIVLILSRSRMIVYCTYTVPYNIHGPHNLSYARYNVLGDSDSWFSAVSSVASRCPGMFPGYIFGASSMCPGVLVDGTVPTTYVIENFDATVPILSGSPIILYVYCTLQHTTT